MPRTRLAADVRFADVFEVLQQANMYGGLKFKAVDERHAIHICHRMNLCRKAVAEEHPDTKLYRFIIRVVGDEVHIVQRQILDLSRCTQLNGDPLPEAVDDTTEEYKRIYAEQKRIATENFEALKNKPLDLDTE